MNRIEAKAYIDFEDALHRSLARREISGADQDTLALHELQVPKGPANDETMQRMAARAVQIEHEAQLKLQQELEAGHLWFITTVVLDQTEYDEKHPGFNERRKITKLEAHAQTKLLELPDGQLIKREYIVYRGLCDDGSYSSSAPEGYLDNEQYGAASVLLGRLLEAYAAGVN